MNLDICIIITTILLTMLVFPTDVSPSKMTLLIESRFVEVLLFTCRDSTDSSYLFLLEIDDSGGIALISAPDMI